MPELYRSKGWYPFCRHIAGLTLEILRKRAPLVGLNSNEYEVLRFVEPL